MAAMPAMRPIVDQANVDSSRPRSVSPRNSESRWPVISSAVALQLGDRRLVLARVLGGGEGGAGLALRSAELGVRGAVGDPFEVAVDEAGVGLGLGAGGHLLVGVLDEVVAALLLE